MCVKNAAVLWNETRGDYRGLAVDQGNMEHIHNEIINGDTLVQEVRTQNAPNTTGDVSVEITIPILFDLVKGNLEFGKWIPEKAKNRTEPTQPGKNDKTGLLPPAVPVKKTSIKRKHDLCRSDET